MFSMTKGLMNTMTIMKAKMMMLLVIIAVMIVKICFGL